jgi:hypothetical protein
MAAKKGERPHGLDPFRDRVQHVTQVEYGE